MTTRSVRPVFKIKRVQGLLLSRHVRLCWPSASRGEKENRNKEQSDDLLGRPRGSPRWWLKPGPQFANSPPGSVPSPFQKPSLGPLIKPRPLILVSSSPGHPTSCGTISRSSDQLRLQWPCRGHKLQSLDRPMSPIPLPRVSWRERGLVSSDPGRLASAAVTYQLEAQSVS